MRNDASTSRHSRSLTPPHGHRREQLDVFGHVDHERDLGTGHVVERDALDGGDVDARIPDDDVARPLVDEPPRLRGAVGEQTGDLRLRQPPLDKGSHPERLRRETQWHSVRRVGEQGEVVAQRTPADDEPGLGRHIDGGIDDGHSSAWAARSAANESSTPNALSPSPSPWVSQAEATPPSWR